MLKITQKLLKLLLCKRGETAIYTFEKRQFIVESAFTGKGETLGEILLKIIVNSSNSRWTSETKCGTIKEQTPLVDCTKGAV